MTRKLPYSEGTWFAVPLTKGGYGVGVVARMDGTGGILGYFFGPVREEVPPLEEVVGYGPDEAELVDQFGALGLLEGGWPVIGQDPDWDRSRWPLPGFYLQDLLSGATWRVEYDDRLTRVREARIDPDETEGLVRDGLSGAEAMRIALTKVLSGEELPWPPPKAE